MKRLFSILLIVSILLYGCDSRSVSKSTSVEPDYNNDPLIGVVMEDGTVAYTSEEYQQALLRIHGSANSANQEPTNSDIAPETKPILTSIDVNNDAIKSIQTAAQSPVGPVRYEGTIQETTDRTSSIAAISIALRTILSQYLGNEYEADFGYDGGVINIPRNKIKADADTHSVEKILEDAAKEAGLTDYHISINLVNGDISGVPAINTGSGVHRGNADNFYLYDNPEQQNTLDSYVLNTNTMKFHYPHCQWVPRIAPEHYQTSNDRGEIVAQGYEPCKACNP